MHITASQQSKSKAICQYFNKTLSIEHPILICYSYKIRLWYNDWFFYRV